MKNKDRWIKLGIVGVDSGQLLVTDPCYINSEWKKGGVEFERKLYDTRKKRYVTSPNSLLEQGINWDSDYEKGITYNEALEKSILKQEPEKETKEYSYDGCCKATVSGFGGQLNYKKGHAGAGVCFPSGFGDGHYEVSAKISDEGDWGERVKEVRIKLM